MGPLALVCSMSMTCHRMRDLVRRFLRIISAMTALSKSMFVMFWQPWSYLHHCWVTSCNTHHGSQEADTGSTLHACSQQAHCSSQTARNRCMVHLRMLHDPQQTCVSQAGAEVAVATAWHQHPAARRHQASQ